LETVYLFQLDTTIGNLHWTYGVFSSKGRPCETPQHGIVI